MIYINKNLKKILITGVSILMLTGIGTDISSVSVNARHHRIHRSYHHSTRYNLAKLFLHKSRRSLNFDLNSVNWYIKNSKEINKYFSNLDPISEGSGYYQYGIDPGDGFDADEIRRNPYICKLGYVIERMGTTNLSPKSLSHHKKHIARSIKNWNAMYQLVRKYPHAMQISAEKDEDTGYEVSTGITHWGGHNITYVNGHKMTKYEKNRLNNELM